MAVNDALVRAIISTELSRFASEPGCCGAVHRAFRELQRRRRLPGGSLDENLAAAEHYMFARWSVCEGSVSATQMRAMVLGYDSLKMFGLGPLMQTTSNPTAPASVASLRWGMTGVNDGDAQHSRCNSAVVPPLFNTDAYSYGSRYGSGYGGGS